MIKIFDSSVSYEMIGQGVPILILHGYGVDREIMKGFLEPIFQKKS